VISGWIQADLGSARQIDHIELLPVAYVLDGWNNVFLNGADVEYSNDGVSWSAAGSVSGAAENVYATVNMNVSARYIRLKFPGFGSLAVGDFRIFGVESSGVAAMVTSISNGALDTHIHLDYDVTGQVAQSVDALGNTTSYAYNTFGELVTRTDPLSVSVSVQTANTYDRRGQLLSTTRDAAGGGLQLTTAFAYDAFGRAIQVTDADGKVRATTARGGWLRRRTRWVRRAPILMTAAATC
jgi:YD repeat-containing protein